VVLLIHIAILKEILAQILNIVVQSLKTIAIRLFNVNLALHHAVTHSPKILAHGMETQNATQRLIIVAHMLMMTIVKLLMMTAGTDIATQTTLLIQQAKEDADYTENAAMKTKENSIAKSMMTVVKRKNAVMMILTPIAHLLDIVFTMTMNVALVMKSHAQKMMFGMQMEAPLWIQDVLHIVANNLPYGAMNIQIAETQQHVVHSEPRNAMVVPNALPQHNAVRTPGVQKLTHVLIQNVYVVLVKKTKAETHLTLGLMAHVAQLLITISIQFPMEVQDVALMYLEMNHQIAALTPIKYGILKLKLAIYQNAHVKDVAISTVVMSWTTSCTRPSLTSTKETE
jgi:hypothetical protein